MVPIQEALTIGETEESAILGMPFLVGRDCVLNFGRLLLRVNRHVVV